MNEISMVIVGYDEVYLASLEIGLLKEIGSMVSLTVITNTEYFNHFFSLPQKIDVLLIEKELYGPSIERQNIEKIFVLEESEEEGLYKQNVTGIYKFASAKEIFHKISGKIGREINDKNRNIETSKTILVYSPVGGCGKTSLALSVSCELARFNKRVLYVNMETIQNFHWLLRNKDYVSEEYCHYLSRRNPVVVDKIGSYVGNEEFDYIKPIQGATISYGIKSEDYLFFINELIKSKKYDYIILDTSAELDICNSKMMGICDKVLTIVQQDAMSVWKVEGFLENIDYSDQDKFIFVCNKYKKHERNFILESEFLSDCNVTEYVTWLNDDVDINMLNVFGSNHVMKQTAMLIL